MSEDHSDLQDIVAAISLSRRPGVGARVFKDLVGRYGSPRLALEAFEVRGARPRRRAAARKARFDANLRDIIEGVPGVETTWYGASDYPGRLAALSEPPPYLFHTGPLWPLPPSAVAIVGARSCTRDGAEVAAMVATRLTAQGVSIVSGGALGIDGAAHRATLDAGGAPVLVAATGLDRVYPPVHQELFREVRRRGCLLTELIPGTPPRRDFFPTRNRIIAGLSAAVVVIEGEAASGTASTARHAARAGRPIFAWCESPSRSLRALPARLVEHGARALDLDRLETLLEEAPQTTGSQRSGGSSGNPS